jgi:hypothetical protein
MPEEAPASLLSTAKRIANPSKSDRINPMTATHRFLLLGLANAMFIAGATYFAAIDIRGIIVPSVFMVGVNIFAVCRIIRPLPNSSHDERGQQHTAVAAE